MGVRTFDTLAGRDRSGQRQAIIAGAVFAALLFVLQLSSEVLAFSVMARYGMGDMRVMELTGGSAVSPGVQETVEESYWQAGIDVFFYEAKRWDLFAGIEQSRYKQKITYDVSATSLGKAADYFDGTATALDLGGRVKFPLGGRVTPYASLALLFGYAKFDIPGSMSGLIDPGSSWFATARIGAGLDIGLTERISAVLQYDYTGGMPIYSTDVYPALTDKAP